LNAVWTRNQFPAESSTMKSARPFLLIIFVVVSILSYFVLVLRWQRVDHGTGGLASKIYFIFFSMFIRACSFE